MSGFVKFDPRTRLVHLEEHLRRIHRNLPIEEARIQLLRCRLVAYKLIAEIRDSRYDKSYVDRLMSEIYDKLSEISGSRLTDPYMDPCESQYKILEELKSYRYRDPNERFMRFVREEFREIFIPTLFLLTYLCRSEKKYTWDEVKLQLDGIMRDLGVDVSWDECEDELKRYARKVFPVLDIAVAV
ncbi:MAG: hypothetical protein QW781_00520 [Methanothrix sp.]